jgi:two-component system cell cycle sensor histidine kinase PleC
MLSLLMFQRGLCNLSVRMMLSASAGLSRQTSLMAEYSSLLADSVLRHKAWFAEHSARIETQLASKVKSEFIANMSHELRTPLNTVIGFSKLLGEHKKRQLEDADIVEYAGLIRDAATHLLAVINDILDISKIESGKFTLDAREVELDEVLNVALTSFRPAATQVGVQLESRIDANLPVVKGDPGKLRQVFNNLLGNAVKFTPPGGMVTLDARALADGGVSVHVRDTGLGMTKDEIIVALTPFAQVDASHSRWREGTGLGLPIAKALVQLHGGQLVIRSAKSLGTEVVVTLPPPGAVSDARLGAAGSDSAQ